MDEKPYDPRWDLSRALNYTLYYLAVALVIGAVFMGIRHWPHSLHDVIRLSIGATIFGALGWLLRRRKTHPLA